MQLRSRRQLPCSTETFVGAGGSDEKAPMFTRSRLLCLAACVSVLIMGCFYTLSDGSSSPSKRSNIAPSTHSFHVVCYGDSLTAGMSPPLPQKQPYAPHLQSELNSIQKSMQASSKVQLPPVVVTWRGMPGWTAEEMLQRANDTRTGIVPLVKFSPRTPDVAVIMAGTNDLGHKRLAKDILSDVVDIHKLCFKMGIERTVAVGVPPSAWQTSKEEVAAAAREVNVGLEKFCNATQDATGEGQRIGNTASAFGVAKFVPFPFPFDTASGRWAKDGLHFTPKGYAHLGKSLAEPVEEILSVLRRTRSAKTKRKGWFQKGSK